MGQQRTASSPAKAGIQYAETSVIEWIGRGVLDTPHARGMTAYGSAYFFCP